jgi:hypothetical protein
MTLRERATVLGQVAERVALWNEFRTDDFRDHVAHLVSNAREHWRERDELPPRGADRLFDALMHVADIADSSPIAVRDACAEAMRAAEDATVAR